MIADELLSIEPQELQFPFELKKQISCSLQLRNKSDNYVAFKVKTTNPKKYCVRPNTGVVLPRLSCDVIVTMQAQKEMPLDMQCKDKFLLQSVITSPGATAKDITPEMFNKEAGHEVEECKLRVVYVAPAGPPSPVREESEEGSSPRASVSDNGNFSTSEQSAVSRSNVQRPQPEDNSPEAKALISKLTEEKNSAVQQNRQLQKELRLRPYRICKLGKASIANQAMASLVKAPPTMSTINAHQVHLRKLKLLSNLNMHHGLRFPRIHVNHTTVCCTKLTPWEPSPVTYAPTIDASGNLLKKTSNIFETLKSEDTAEAPATNSEELTDTKNQSLVQFQFLKWPMWLLGPSLLLTTGMVPTLWLPLSSVFLGPNIASLLSLIGLDCIFNLGATLFLLMADSCSRSKNQAQTCNSKPPLSYKFWNMVATVSGFVIPLMALLGSQKGTLQPQLPFIPFAVLLGPYMLLLSVQILTELLTWHWQSPVWLVTPVVYESYRLLQLMRGLKLGAELSAPTWMLHMIRGLVSWWILILGVQLMSVAWFAGFAAQSQQQHSPAASGG